MLDDLLDALEFPKEPVPEAEALADRFGAGPDVRRFLARSLHASHADTGMNAFDPLLVSEWVDEDRHFDEDVAKLLPFADDGGGRLFLLDPSDHLGFGADAVYTVGMGTRAADDLERVAPSLLAFLQALLDGDELPQERLHPLRDAQTAGRVLPLRLGDGRTLPADAVTDPRYHIGADVLRSVCLTRPLDLDIPCVPDAHRPPWSTVPDVSFYRTGRIERAVVAGGWIDGRPVQPHSSMAWRADGTLTSFVPAQVVVVNGVPVKAGVPVHHDGDTFFFTPARDVTWKGFLCAAGEKVDDYGPGLGLHLTTATSFSFRGRPVPAGVRLTVMSGGGLRFTLVAPLQLGDRALPAGASLWYEADGAIREVHVPRGA